MEWMVYIALRHLKLVFAYIFVKDHGGGTALACRGLKTGCDYDHYRATFKHMILLHNKCSRLRHQCVNKRKKNNKWRNDITLYLYEFKKV